MKKYLIYLVDDDPVFTEMMYESLCDNPKLEIKNFDTGERCLQQLDKKPDLIVLDYFLDLKDPNAKNGLEVLSIIRQVLPDVEVIVLSGQLLPDVTFDFIMTYDVTHYLVKDENAIQNLQMAVDSVLIELESGI
ncbi:MAG TPA: hypothetical protein DCQ31_03795 [Bacteroidales bacterium]|nr:hypothetical protein [Bacteroidales bacterium]